MDKFIVHLSSLPDNYTPRDVAKMLEPFGKVVRCLVQHDMVGEEVTTRGWVAYETAQQARAAVTSYHEVKPHLYWAPAEVTLGFSHVSPDQEESEGEDALEEDEEDWFMHDLRDLDTSEELPVGEWQREVGVATQPLVQTVLAACEAHRQSRATYYADYDKYRRLRLERSDAVTELAVGLTAADLDSLAMLVALSASRHTMVVTFVERTVAQFRAPQQRQLYGAVEARVARQVRDALKRSTRGISTSGLDQLMVPCGDRLGGLTIPMFKDGLRFMFDGALTASARVRADKVANRSSRFVYPPRSVDGRRFLNDHVVVPAVIPSRGARRQWYEGPAGSNVVVYNLPPAVTERELIASFQPFGRIVSANVTPSYGFVCFSDQFAAQRAVRNVTVVGGQLLQVVVERYNSVVSR